MDRIERLPAFQGIGAGNTATLNIPLGPTVHRFDIRCNADISGTAKNLAPDDWASVIGDIRINVDGNTKIETTAEYLVKRAQFYGVDLRAGVLPIFLGMPWAQTAMGQDLTAYGTAQGMATFTMEVDIKDGAAINLLKCYAQQSEPRPFGKHLVIRRFAKSFAATGISEISDLPRGNHNLVALDITSTSIGEVEVLADNNRVHVSDKEIREQQYYISNRLKQSGITHLDFIPKSRIALVKQDGTGRTVVDAEAFPMALQDWRLKLDFTSTPTGNTFEIYETTIQG